MKISVGLSEMKISQKPEDTLVARDVGTGMSLAIHDPVTHIGGVYHIMLPSANVYPEVAKKKPLMFADTGIPLFIQAMCEQGADKKRLVVNVAGGADLLPKGKAIFSIGKQNFIKTAEILKRNKLFIQHYIVGGSKIRSMFLNVGSGRTWVDTN